jgi:hypothetical protein
MNFLVDIHYHNPVVEVIDIHHILAGTFHNFQVILNMVVLVAVAVEVFGIVVVVVVASLVTDIVAVLHYFVTIHLDNSYHN